MPIFEIEDNSVSFEDLLGTSEPNEPTSEPTQVVDIPEPSASEPTEPAEPAEPTEPTEPNEGEEEEEVTDFLQSFLKDYGIQDGKIRYANDDGTESEVNFNELDQKERLSILRELTTPNLSKEEIDTINYLRENKTNLKSVIDAVSQQAVDNYIKQNGPVEKTYSVDEYTDDELYVADLKSKYDMTEDELLADLESAKANEELFQKKIGAIREQYKKREEEIAQKEVAAQEEKVKNFRDSITNSLNSFNEITMDYKDSKADRLQVENSEKNAIYEYLTSQDENGATRFFKDLNDPEVLVEMAWFRLFGADAMSDISNYWKSQLKSVRTAPKSEPKTTIVPKDTKKTLDVFTNHRNSVETVFGDNLI
ncbi:MAG: hypothetical protein KBT03_08905 [Bacteroidales bacterium]|nr:hypothetical protein [Candidatus Scybalousia scybalohippi]